MTPRPAIPRIPRPIPAGEAAFALHCRVDGIPVVPQFKFAPDREWRADFAFPEARLLVEIEGGIWKGGGHNRGVGFQKDIEKYNRATELGWWLMRFTTQQAKEGRAVEMVKNFLKGRKGCGCGR